MLLRENDLSMEEQNIQKKEMTLIEKFSDGEDSFRRTREEIEEKDRLVREELRKLDEKKRALLKYLLKVNSQNCLDDCVLIKVKIEECAKQIVVHVNGQNPQNNNGKGDYYHVYASSAENKITFKELCCTISMFIPTDTRRSGSSDWKQNVSTDNTHLDICDTRIQENNRILGENICF